MALTPLTELDAVNIILMDMGEAPINSLSGDLPLDAQKARLVLKEISRTVQNRGWHWNKEYSEFPIDGSNNIPLPTNTLAVHSETLTAHLTVRNGKLYRIERNNNGDDFTASEALTITYFLPFEELPPAAARYITIRAARVHQARELGDDVLLRNASAEEEDAWASMRRESNRNSNRTLKKSWSIAMITDRHSLRMG